MRGETHEETRRRVGRMWRAKRRARDKRMAERLARKGKVEKMQDNAFVAPPAPNWLMVANRTLTIGRVVYPRGALVDPEVVGARAQTLLRTGHLGFVPPSSAHRPAAYELPPTLAAPPARSKIEVIEGADDLESWKKTRDRAIEVCGGNVALAEDLLAVNRDTIDLGRRARAAAEALKRKQHPGMISCDPHQALRAHE